MLVIAVLQELTGLLVVVVHQYIIIPAIGDLGVLLGKEALGY